MMSQMKKLKELGYKDEDLDVHMYESLGYCSGNQELGDLIFGKRRLCRR
jgi:hypothetical protein